MSDEDPLEQTMWQKVRRRAPAYEGEEKRSASPGLPIWLVAVVTLVPLITVLGSGFTAYVKRGAVIEQMQKEIVEINATNKAQWERIGDVMGAHAE